MLQVRFNNQDAAIKLSKITEIADIDPQILVDTINNVNNIINKVREYNINVVIDKFVSERQNRFVTLNEIEKEIFKDFYYFRIFLNYTDVATTILSNINIYENSDEYNNLFKKSILLGFPLSTFDESNILEFMVSFFTIHLIYRKSIAQRKYYVPIDEFYNCTIEDIFDYCIL